ncbi:hypothetical protein FFLO_01326 [Filobasidium floriforme]|uniref:Flap endonuclease 1 n=1 Tax=Filobasidium floriforme TaxID=5210 RepID=A0A8K0JRG4_9TREE|nr:hypothetical protein FFLO_01326 [Filobasidium floriforme]
MKEHDIKTLFGRKVAIDASMSIYQFLVAVRQKDGTMLMNENGDVTSHLMGFFFRTLRMVDHGIKPMYVFDGKPPDLKGGVLAKRFATRNAAAEAEAEAKEVGTTEDIDKLARRQVKPTRQHNEECRRLLGLMGIPFLIAPGEAEAQCAELARAGKVYAAGSEDMDTLTFNSPLLLRHLTFSEAKKAPISEINLKVVLEELDMTMERFIELCILLGCDYLEPAKGIGPKTALKLMREHGSLEAIESFVRGKMAEKVADAQAEAGIEPEEIESDEEDKAPPSPDVDMDLESEDGYEKRVAADMSGDEEEMEGAGTSSKASKKKKVVVGIKGGMQLPEYWPWREAKEVFMKPDVTPGDDLELDWKRPDIEGLVQFLCREKGFAEDRVRNGCTRLEKMLGAKQQGRLDSFFKPTGVVTSSKTASSKAGDSKGKGGAKRKVSLFECLETDTGRLIRSS